VTSLELKFDSFKFDVRSSYSMAKGAMSLSTSRETEETDETDGAEESEA